MITFNEFKKHLKCYTFKSSVATSPPNIIWIAQQADHLIKVNGQAVIQIIQPSIVLESGLLDLNAPVTVRYGTPIKELKIDPTSTELWELYQMVKLV